MRKIGIIGIICLCCVGAFIAMPASAFFGGGAGHPAQGGAPGTAYEEKRGFGGCGHGFGADTHGAPHPAAPVLAALDESGYDTSELKTLLDTAQGARENGDCETASETMQEFRTELKTAVDESGITVGFERCGFQHGQCFRSA